MKKILSEIIELNHIKFIDSCDSWENAIRESCQPIEEDGSVEKVYGEKIIECVNEYGPYIVIAPKIALPHHQEKAEGVNKTAISFMKVKKPVEFDKDDRELDANLFFTIASKDHNEHIDNLTALSEILVNDDIVEDLLKVDNKADLVEVAKKYNI